MKLVKVPSLFCPWTQHEVASVNELSSVTANHCLPTPINSTDTYQALCRKREGCPTRIPQRCHPQVLCKSTDFIIWNTISLLLSEIAPVTSHNIAVQHKHNNNMCQLHHNLCFFSRALILHNVIFSTNHFNRHILRCAENYITRHQGILSFFRMSILSFFRM